MDFTLIMPSFQWADPYFQLDTPPPHLGTTSHTWTEFSRQAGLSAKVNIRLKVIVMNQIEINVKVMVNVKVQVKLTVEVMFKDINAIVQIKA